MRISPMRASALALTLVALLAGCAGSAPGAGDDPASGEDPAFGPLTVYSGRSEELVGSVLDRFVAETGIELAVRYAGTAELAATILEEGAASPADVFIAQDAGALGAVEGAGRFRALPDEVLELVAPGFRSPAGMWVGVTGRVRVLAYNTEVLDSGDVPVSVFELSEPQWRGRVGWAPENGSFQAFVTAMRLVHGDETSREWLEAMVANQAVAFPNNTGAIEGVARGEVDVALVNHYYLYRFLAEDPAFPVANAYLPGDIGGLVNVAGAGVLDTSEVPEQAYELIRFLLAEDTQTYFGQVTDELEFPLRTGVDAPGLPSLESLDPPQVDLSRLDDLQATLEMLHEVGALA